MPPRPAHHRLMYAHKQCRVPRGRFGRHRLQPARPVDHRAADVAGRAGRDIGGNALRAQHDRLVRHEVENVVDAVHCGECVVRLAWGLAALQHRAAGSRAVLRLAAVRDVCFLPGAREPTACERRGARPRTRNLRLPGPAGDRPVCRSARRTRRRRLAHRSLPGVTGRRCTSYRLDPLITRETGRGTNLVTHDTTENRSGRRRWRRHRLQRPGHGGPSQCRSGSPARRSRSPRSAADRWPGRRRPRRACAAPPGPPPVPEIANPKYGSGHSDGPLGFLRDAWHQAQDPYNFAETPDGQMPGGAPPPSGAGPAPQLPPGFKSLNAPGSEAPATGPAPDGGPAPAGSYAGGPPLPPGYYPLNGPPPPPEYFNPPAAPPAAAAPGPIHATNLPPE